MSGRQETDRARKAAADAVRTSGTAVLDWLRVELRAAQDEILSRSAEHAAEYRGRALGIQDVLRNLKREVEKDG